MGKYLDAIKKISNGSGSALIKLTQLPHNGFASFVGPHPKRLAENISLSDEIISPKHESYELTKPHKELSKLIPPNNFFIGSTDKVLKCEYPLPRPFFSGISIFFVLKQLAFGRHERIMK